MTPEDRALLGELATRLESPSYAAFAEEARALRRMLYVPQLIGYPALVHVVGLGVGAPPGTLRTPDASDKRTTN